jgi:hypothetical protein
MATPEMPRATILEDDEMVAWDRVTDADVRRVPIPPEAPLQRTKLIGPPVSGCGMTPIGTP